MCDRGASFYYFVNVYGQTVTGDNTDYNNVRDRMVVVFVRYIYIYNVHVYT